MESAPHILVVEDDREVSALVARFLRIERSIDIIVCRLLQKMEKNPKKPPLFQTIRSGSYLFSPGMTSA